jgi:uncharacterized protein YmfQ (DUF2313 family)
MLLPDWERAWGLPDLCLDEPLTIADRQNALVGKMTTIGAQSRAFFTAQALRVGYVVTIHEWSPFMCGISMCGDTRNLDNGVNYRWEIGGPTMRYYWAVRVGALRFSWFRASSGQAGIDPMLRIGIATDLECLLRRLAPAHTDLIFDYSIIAELDFNKPFDSGYIEMLPM